MIQAVQQGWPGGKGQGPLAASLGPVAKDPLDSSAAAAAADAVVQP